MPSVVKFNSLHSEYTNSLDALCSAYNSEYLKAHLRTGIRVGYKGRISTYIYTVHEWEEPSNVPKHGSVFEWQHAQNEIVKRSQNVASKQLIDCSKANNVRIIKENARDSSGKAMLNIVIYGTEIGLLLGYEEVWANVSYEGWDRISSEQTLRMINTSTQISRRALFKIAASLAGAATAYTLSTRNMAETEKGSDTLRRELQIIPQLMQATPAYSFERYFGTSALQHRQRVNNVVLVARQTLQDNIQNEKVRQTFENLVVQGQKYSEELSQFFINGVPQDFADMTNAAVATENIEKICKQNKVSPNLNILIEGLVVGGIMTAVLIPAEIINNTLR